MREREREKDREKESHNAKRKRFAPLSSNLTHHPLVKPRLWPWLELCVRLKALTPLSVYLSHSTAAQQRFNSAPDHCLSKRVDRGRNISNVFKDFCLQHSTRSRYSKDSILLCSCTSLSAAERPRQRTKDLFKIFKRNLVKVVKIFSHFLIAGERKRTCRGRKR